MTITVANLRTTRAGIRCDRASALGNPFELRTETERPAVIEAFRRYLWRVVQGHDPREAALAIASEMELAVAPKWSAPDWKLFMQTLALIEQEATPVLLCWCSPLPCHCDVVAAYLQWKRSPPRT